MRLLLLAIAAIGAATLVADAHAATQSTTLQTSYARASTYRATQTVETDARAADSTDDSSRDNSGKPTQSAKSNARRAGTRDDATRPRWHSTLPGMIR